MSGCRLSGFTFDHGPLIPMSPCKNRNFIFISHTEIRGKMMEVMFLKLHLRPNLMHITRTLAPCTAQAGRVDWVNGCPQPY